MHANGILTFLTDFGTADAYVAAMKGVALSRAPNLRLIDLSHEVPVRDIQRGAYVLAEAAPWFPAGTVHVVVVDPGVGTPRRGLVAVLDDQIIVGPDNGLISRLYNGSERREVYELARADLGALHRSMTFHGRDLFAPAGAMVASGKVRPEDCGPAIDPVLIADPQPRRVGEVLWGEVLTVDHFGNLVTNIWAEDLPTAPLIRIAGQPVEAFVRTYRERPAGTLVALVGSGGLLEVAVVDGNAAEKLALGVGATIELRDEDDGE